jgi:hypothetical protein
MELKGLTPKEANPSTHHGVKRVTRSKSEERYIKIRISNAEAKHETNVR